MKKHFTSVLCALLSLTLLLCLAGCGEQLTLESNTVNGVTLDVPSDFGEFAGTAAMMMASNENSTATIGISPPVDAQGVTAADLDAETYVATQMASYSGVEVVEFDNEAELDGVSALYAHATGNNSQGVALNVYNYMVFHDDGTFQHIVLSFAPGTDTSLEANIDAVLESITLG